MHTTLTLDIAVVTASQEVQAVKPEPTNQAISELGALELALIGGGSGAVSFY